MTMPGYEVNPTYVRTAVRPADPNALREYNVVSLAHDHRISDAMKLVRAQVEGYLRSRGGNTLLVTSVGPSEGKTFTAANLAVSFSHQSDRTVLLVDADLRNPTVHRCFGVPAERGLSDLLLRGDSLPDLLLNPGIPRLTLLPAGQPVSNSTELLGAPRMAALVQEMKQRYQDRLLIFDAPPLLTSADSLVFSRLVDSVLLVVEAEETSRRALKRGLELLAGTPVVGFVLNKTVGEQ